MNKLDGIEAGRGIAALLVLLAHATIILGLPQNLGVDGFNGLFEFGHAGVEFFFVLSGFIIFYIHHQDIARPDRLSNYWQKRFVRIVPTYWIVLALYGCILVFSPTAQRHEREFDTIFRSIFLLPGGHGQILGVAWTLTREFLFYSMFSVLLINRKAGIVLFISWFSLLSIQLLFQPFPSVVLVDFTLQLFNLGFFLGMFAAKLIVSKRVIFEKALMTLGLLLFFSVGLFESFAENIPKGWWLLHTCYLLGSTLFIVGVVSYEQKHGLKVPRFLLTIGKASYSIYLTHVIVLMIFAEVTNLFMWLSPNVFFSLCIVGSVFAGILFSKFVEFPVISVVNGWFKAKLPKVA